VRLLAVARSHMSSDRFKVVRGEQTIQCRYCVAHTPPEVPAKRIKATVRPDAILYQFLGRRRLHDLFIHAASLP
jgi:hypothetical protein